MNSYIVKYSIGTSRHDEQRFKTEVKARSLSHAVSQVENTAKRKMIGEQRVVVTSVVGLEIDAFSS